ncbi:hypothetical protein AgCh_026851 [Apium graveolens]
MAKIKEWVTITEKKGNELAAGSNCILTTTAAKAFDISRNQGTVTMPSQQMVPACQSQKNVNDFTKCSSDTYPRMNDRQKLAIQQRGPPELDFFHSNPIVNIRLSGHDGEEGHMKN